MFFSRRSVAPTTKSYSPLFQYQTYCTVERFLKLFLPPSKPSPHQHLPPTNTSPYQHLPPTNTTWSGSSRHIDITSSGNDTAYVVHKCTLPDFSVLNLLGRLWPNVTGNGYWPTSRRLQSGADKTSYLQTILHYLFSGSPTPACT